MSSHLLFEELIRRLKHDGFAVGTDQILRMYALLEEVPAATPAELRTLLSPIFATSGQEQERFYAAFDEFFSAPPVAAPQPTPVPAERLQKSVWAATRRSVASKTRQGWSRLVVPAVVAVLVIMIAIASFPDRNGNAESTTAAVTTSTQAVDTGEQKDDDRRKRDSGRWWLATLAACGILFGAEVVRTVVRALSQKERNAHGRPFEWPLRDAAPPRLFTDSSFFRAARLLKGREAADDVRLDIRRSIDATMRALGDPTLDFAHVRHPSEYLILIERLSDRDHLAAFGRQLAQALDRDGVLVELYEYSRDPRQCTRVGAAVPIATTDLYQRFPRHRVIVIGRANAFVDTVTDEMHGWVPRAFPWTWRALLTTDDEVATSPMLEPVFDVFDLAEDGLLRLAERWQHPDAFARPLQHRSSRTADFPEDLAHSVREIEELLEPALFRWLLRCSVHPLLEWELTRALAPEVPDPERERLLLMMSRLTWFREGRIPEPVRLALVQRLGADRPEEATARTVVLTLLRATDGPRDGSVAARMLAIERLTHQIFQARDDRGALRPLLRELRRFPRGLIVRDRALLQLLRGVPGQPLPRTLPRSLRRAIYRDGIPAFGAHNFIGLLLILPVMAYAAWEFNSQSAADTTVVTSTDTLQTNTDTTGSYTTATDTSGAYTTATDTSGSYTSGTDTSRSDAAGTATVATDTVRSGGGATSGTAVEPDPPAPVQLSPGGTVRIKRGEAITFRWRPSGTYDFGVWSERKRLVSQRVNGTSMTWTPPENVSRFAWDVKRAGTRRQTSRSFTVVYIDDDAPPAPFLNGEGAPPAAEPTTVSDQQRVTVSCRERRNGSLTFSLKLQAGQQIVTAVAAVERAEGADASAQVVQFKSNLVLVEYEIRGYAERSAFSPLQSVVPSNCEGAAVIRVIAKVQTARSP